MFARGRKRGRRKSGYHCTYTQSPPMGPRQIGVMAPGPALWGAPHASTSTMSDVIMKASRGPTLGFAPGLVPPYGRPCIHGHARAIHTRCDRHALRSHGLPRTDVRSQFLRLISIVAPLVAEPMELNRWVGVVAAVDSQGSYIKTEKRCYGKHFIPNQTAAGQ